MSTSLSERLVAVFFLSLVAAVAFPVPGSAEELKSKDRQIFCVKLSEIKAFLVAAVDHKVDAMMKVPCTTLKADVTLFVDKVEKDLRGKILILKVHVTGDDGSPVSGYTYVLKH